MTPEEYETVMVSIYEAKLNMKLFASVGAMTTLAFSFWQRAHLPRWYYPIAMTTGLMTGALYGLIRTGWHLCESVDALGKDYEISRLLKQDIFDSRPDMDPGMRAQYYIHQQNNNEKI